MSELYWTCHVCGNQRPNSKIGVMSRDVDYGHGVIAKENVRYCNDRAKCREGAQTYRHTQSGTVVEDEK